MNKNLLYRSIPKVDILLADEGIKVLIETYSRESVMEAIHSEMEKLRAFIGVCEEEEKAKQQIALLNENIAKAVSAMHTPNMKKVINGTGTILHTNLGRAPISFGHMMRQLRSSVDIRTWNIIWKQEEEESGIHILKNYCVS